MDWSFLQMHTGDWTHATMGGAIAVLRECRRGFLLPRLSRRGKAVRVYPGSIAVVALCAIAAYLWDHSLLTSAGIGSLGLDAWRLLGRGLDELKPSPRKRAEAGDE